MTEASKILNQSDNIRYKAVGAFLFDLIDKASAAGSGFSKRKQAKQGSIFCSIPPLLGQFRIDVTHPDFSQIFTSRANI
jgi:hypothetical protein